MLRYLLLFWGDHIMLKMVKFSFWQPSLKGSNLTYSQLVVVKSIIRLKSRRKMRLTKIRLFSRDNLIYRVGNAHFHYKILCDNLLTFTGIFFSQGRWIIIKFGMAMTEAFRSGLVEFSLAQSYMNLNQGVWNAKTNYFCCFHASSGSPDS